VLGGLLDKEMNPKPAYQALDRLINHDWKTNLMLDTDANGKASFRGFFGDYTAIAEAGGKTVKKTLRLNKGTANKWMIEF